MDPTSWLRTHRTEALVGGGALVGLFALYRSRKAAAAAAATPGVAVAGQTGTPDTSATDLQNAVQDQLNAFMAQFQANNPTSAASATTHPAGGPWPNIPVIPAAPAAAPAPAPANPNPTPAPAPAPAPAAAWQTYTVRPGDSLWAIAQRIWGAANPTNVGQLATWNGVRLYQQGGVTYGLITPGQQIRYQK